MTNSQKEACEVALGKLRDHLKMHGRALSTQRDYCREVKRYIGFICSRNWDNGATSESKAEAFLTAEAKRGVAESTQNGSFHAICYYYRHVIKKPLVDVDALRSKVGERVRQCPPTEDVRKILMAVRDVGAYPARLVVWLIASCGLRIGETLSIRIKDLDLDRAKLTIIQGKGKKDRFINLPPSIVESLRLQVAAAEATWKKAKAMGVPVKLPHKYGEKNPAARFQRKWFFLFPMMQPCDDPSGGGRVWWHCLEDTVQRALRAANKVVGTEGWTAHHLRHWWAVRAAESGARIEDIQVVLGHRDIKTTLRYVHPDPERVPSPIETIGIAI